MPIDGEESGCQASRQSSRYALEIVGAALLQCVQLPELFLLRFEYIDRPAERIDEVLRLIFVLCPLTDLACLVEEQLDGSSDPWQIEHEQGDGRQRRGD